MFLERNLFYALAKDPNTIQFQAYAVLGQGVACARGAAAALKLDATFILLPVLRNFLSYLRGTWVNNFLPIDKNIVFHRYMGWVCMFWAVVHAIAHYTNYYKIMNANPATLQQVAPLLVQHGVVAGTDAYALAFTTLPGATGHIALLCMFLMYSTALERIRRFYFELFWYVHHLFLIFYAMLVVHGLNELLEQATFWMWLIGPGVLYATERLIRIIRGSVQTIVFEAIQHPSKVMELRLKRLDGKPFSYKSGQYCFLNSPYLAGPEWHPFTITSAPNGDPYLSFHIKAVGDWTNSLTSMLNPEKKMGLVCENMLYAPNGKPIMRVDGGFGAASEEVFGFETVMLIGAGIGVTPFGSILKNIHYRMMAVEGRYDYDASASEPLMSKGRCLWFLFTFLFFYFFFPNFLLLTFFLF